MVTIKWLSKKVYAVSVYLFFSVQYYIKINSEKIMLTKGNSIVRRIKLNIIKVQGNLF